eukprot:CAMPEP_0114992124 /NCGR_PEP_ID=MMETSP0216-20121206/11763_1 /TAXON_ID=223996 /ORGANISM="Protocruzia adherens, Strain Boccale" /LENGTH=347 /DNA_ID=CAMNT_0002355547 /DNA_START=184 /DNA_END=1224 /DNA_ORIENTATION=-
MTGPCAIVLPFAFGQAGVLMGVLTILVTAAASNYSSHVVIDLCAKGEDFTRMGGFYMGNLGKIGCFLFSMVSLGAVAASGFDMLVDAVYRVCVLGFGEFGGVEVVVVVFGLVLVLSMGDREEVFVRMMAIAAYFAILVNFAVLLYGAWAVVKNFDRITFDDGNQEHNHDVVVQLYNSEWTQFSSLLALIFLCQNSLMIVLRNQKDPSNNHRDVNITFGALAFFGALTGIVGYLGFKAEFPAMTQNCLDNFSNDDWFAVLIRSALIFQLGLALPSLTYINRVQFFSFINQQPRVLEIFGFNVVFLLIVITATLFYPTQLAKIMNYGGGISGIGVIFLIPCLCYSTHKW